MFRNFSKFSVAKYWRFNQICSRNVSHGLDTQGVFPGILRKSLIQTWRPAFEDSAKLPAQYTNLDKAICDGKITKQLLVLDLEKKPAVASPIYNTLSKYFQKLKAPENLKVNKSKFTLNTAGRFRKFIGDFQRAYFRTDRVLSSHCKSGKDKDACKKKEDGPKATCKESKEKVDPCAAKKQRKSPKKELGGRCPFIKEECLNKGRKKEGVCKKLKPICGQDKDKKGRCRKVVACKKKDDKTSSGEAGPKKKGSEKSCSERLASKEKDANKKSTCASPKEEDPCDKKRKVCAKKKETCKKSFSRDTCAEKKNSCSSKKSSSSDKCTKKEDSCSNKKSSSGDRCAKKKDSCTSKKSSDDLCAKTKDSCSSKKSSSGDTCAKQKDLCSSKKSSCDNSGKSKKCASKPCPKKKGSGVDKKSAPCGKEGGEKPTCPSKNDECKEKTVSCASIAAEKENCIKPPADPCEKPPGECCEKPPADCSPDPCKVCENLAPKEKKKCERQRKYWMKKKASWEEKWIKDKKNK